MQLESIDALPAKAAQAILRKIFERATTPAFGILPQRELDLLLFEAMRDAGVIARDASLYDLMTDLRITRVKARNLLFDLQIRATREGGTLDGKVKAAIARPRGFAVEGKYLVLGIEDPVVQAHLKEKARALGHITDATFDSTLVRITPGALASVAEVLMNPEEKALYKEAMIDAGYDRDKGLRVALVAGLTHLAGKAVGKEAAGIALEAGAGYIDELADYLAPRGHKALERLRSLFVGLVAGEDAAKRAGPKIRGT